MVKISIVITKTDKTLEQCFLKKLKGMCKTSVESELEQETSI